MDELTEQELTLVFLSNRKLQDMVRDKLLEIENSWNQLVLFTVGKGLSFYDVNKKSPSQINIDRNEIATFVKGVKTLHNDGVFLSGEEMELIYQLECDFENHSELESQIENVELLMESYFDNGYKNIETERYQLDFFLRVYAITILPRNCFIEGDRFVLYEQTVFDYDTGTLEGIGRDSQFKYHSENANEKVQLIPQEYSLER